MNLFSSSDPFQIVAGSSSVVIGAPHHGSRPSVDADWGTGPIASKLAARLGGSSVVVNDLRRVADVNKDPLSIDKLVRHHAVRYQNSLFARRPCFVVEIHGQTSGRFDIEISTGFELVPAIPSDASYLDKLMKLRQALPEAMESRLGQRPTVGVWPIDRDVVKTATNTFTFQKVRRARHLAGLDWYGLHIEFSTALRVGRGSKMGSVQTLSPQIVEALSDALAIAIQSAFEPFPPPQAFIPPRSEAENGYNALPEQLFKVTRSVEGQITENIVLLHPDSLKDVKVLEGDQVVLRKDDEELHSRVSLSRMVQAGQVAMSQRMRHQLNASPGQSVMVARLAKWREKPTVPDDAKSLEPALVVDRVIHGEQPQLWLENEDINRLALHPGSLVSVRGRSALPIFQASFLETDSKLPLRGVALSSRLAGQLGITLGETLRVMQS